MEYTGVKKIGVLNCSHIVNFGSVLQSYATEKIIRRLTGKEVYSIKYVQKKDFTYLRNYFPLLIEKDIVEFKMKGVKRKVYLKFKDRNLADKCLRREKYFHNFVNRYFNFSKTYHGREELSRFAAEYSCFVLGSDQVWHPVNFGSHYYTMEWIPEQIPKIAYAASFGVENLPQRQKKGTADYLNRINCISVREKKGANIVYELTGREVPVVADPTLLIEEKEWNEMCPDISDNNYIFCYFLGKNEEAREYADRLKEINGMKIICIPYMDEINKVDFEFGDIQLFDVGPAEFLSYIKNANFIVTDSFHGTIFSMIFHKQFMVFNRFFIEVAGSTNTRIDTLLEQVGLENRRYTQDDESIKDKIDYHEVDLKIKALREFSLKHLREDLENYGMIP